MYRIDDMVTWRERRRDLLREAEEARLARSVREARPKWGQSLTGKVRRGAALLLSTVGLAAAPVTDGIRAGAGWPELIDPGDGGTAEPVDRGPGIDAFKKGPT